MIGGNSICHAVIVEDGEIQDLFFLSHMYAKANQILRVFLVGLNSFM